MNRPSTIHTGQLNILILKPSSLGDVVQALPVLRMLKRSLPQASLWWWIDTAYQDLLKDDPDLTGLVPFPRRNWNTSAGLRTTAASLWHMRQIRPDIVIDLQCLLRSALVGWLANGKRYIGLDDRRELAHLFYDTAIPRPGPAAHAVEWYLKVLDVLGIPATWDFEWLPTRRTIAETIRQRYQPTEQVWIALCPGARWPTKRWPVTYFAQTAKQILARFPGTRFVVLGSRADMPAADRIRTELGDCCLNLAGQTSIPELVEWIRLARLVISNDSAPMHIAAAVGTPIVTVFGPTDPKRTGPYRARARVLSLSLPCMPCLREHCTWHVPLQCMHEIRPDQVAEAASELLQTTGCPVLPTTLHKQDQ